MTATGPDWALIRRTYDGGRGGSLKAMAARFGVPVGTLFFRCAQDRWCGDVVRRASHNEVRFRARQLVRERPERPVSAIRRQLEREFGIDHEAIPSDRGLRHFRPSSRKPEDIPTEELTLDGLRRHCYECHQLTRHDPCEHCGTLAREAAA